MKTQLPNEIHSLLVETFTLVGESLIDEQIENREEFETLQNKMFEVLKSSMG